MHDSSPGPIDGPALAAPGPSTSTMVAARYHGPGSALTLEEVAIPRPGRTDALVRVAAAGVCHTELQLLAGTLNLGVVPLTLGHEIAGEVVAVGAEARSLREGDRVVAYYYAPCGECGWCRGGRENLCPNTGPQVGFTADGGFAPFVLLPARCLVPLPAGLPLDEASTLGCSVATALHALRAVARVRLGETVVVYGVGAVGYALLQLARLAGARVIAVGRTPAKLQLARELGASHAVDAGAEDVVEAVLAATAGEGADVVFECVAGAETMEQAARMLRRRGRLVFVGYGAEPFVVNPLLLVLREAQVLGAVGNTLEELREAVALAASGQVRSIVSQRLPLADVGVALDALRAGQVIGRAVLLPNGALPADERAPGPDAGSQTGRDRAAVPPAPALARARAQPSRPPAAEAPTEVVTTTGSAGTAGPPAAPSAAGPGDARSSAPCAPGGHTNGQQARSDTDFAPAAGAPPRRERARRGPSASAGSSAVPTGEELEAELLRFIGQGLDAPRDDAAFEALALRLFAYQFAHNTPYRQYCERRGQTPATVTRWQDVPAVPIAAFKEAVLACEPPERAAACFQSSGTTGTKRSQHFHPSLAVYDLSASTNWQAHLLPEGQPMPLLVLSPPREELPHSSLAHYLSLMVERYGAPGSAFLLRQGRLDFDTVAAALRAYEASGEAVVLLGTSFAFVHFFDACAERGVRFHLPSESRIMDTGGFKGQSREISRTELYGLVRDLLGVPRDYCVNMYGLTEHSTQFLDAVLRNRVRGVAAPRYKTVPPWAHTRVLDPETLEEVPAGEIGLLCHHDLANRASVQAVLTEDLGYALGEGFELLGRARGAEARGCSIAIDELLSATQSTEH